MRTVEVNAPLKAVVETAEKQAVRAETGRHVDRLKSAVVSPSDVGGVIEQKFIHPAQGDAPDAGVLNRSALGQTMVSEIGGVPVVSPPAGIASIEGVSPRDESIGVVDGEPSDLWPRLTPRCFKVDLPV